MVVKDGKKNTGKDLLEDDTLQPGLSGHKEGGQNSERKLDSDIRGARSDRQVFQK